MQDTNTTALHTTIEHLYQVFSSYPAPQRVIDYPCVSCFSTTDEHYILNIPLQKLNDHIFGALIESCNIIPFGNDIYKYFVPRVLELTTIENPDFSFSFVEYVHREFAKFDYQNTFSAKEISAIDIFFDAWLQQEFNKPMDEYDEAELFYAAQAGYNAIPFLKEIRHDDNNKIIVKHLVNYILIQKKYKSKKEFTKWSNTGTLKQLIRWIHHEHI